MAKNRYTGRLGPLLVLPALAVAAVAGACSQTTTNAPITPTPAALSAGETKCNQLRTERYQLVAYQRARMSRSTTGMLATPILLVLINPSLGMAAANSDQLESERVKARIEILDLDLADRKCAPNAAAMDQSAEQRKQTDGKYASRGKTESWCQTPTISLTIENARLKGTLSETVDRKATSEVVGNITPDGILQIQFDGKAANYFTGDVDADFKDGVIGFFLRPSPKCTYTFSLSKGQTADFDPPPETKTTLLPSGLHARVMRENRMQ
ncbi:MAG: hypothetical protein JOY81_00075 [Alphaproteobacteria bacterium]|nr:hypothetical protein [Alphaproteobacteria bacterium]